MLKFCVEIELGNAAFGETQDERDYEVARILRNLAKQVVEGYTFVYLNDSNGNPVGTASYKETKE